MNLILLSEDDFVAGTNRVRLSGRRLQHVLAVHRAQAGARLRVGLLNAQRGCGLITNLSPQLLEMEVCLDQPAPAALPLTLLLALPRPKSLKKVLPAVAAMGVKRIVLLNTWRVEKSFWDSPQLAPAALEEQVRLGLEQAGDTIAPEIMTRRRFKPFVEDEVTELIRGSLALVAHPEAAAVCPRAVPGPVTLAVGPEGGFIPYEIDLLRAHGFTAVSLGERRLRVEHAVPALLGRLF
ncbi:MAG: 16S rRNA (uracil(1498)-N(3))-methyltransferase [Deltaproteobacteria bacterium]|nr:16S rRNA (uracil(1498)-N(3))-methyltransferase [Deltaproteobacteria bacterium]